MVEITALQEELIEGVKTWLIPQAAGFFDTGIQKLVPRCDKYLSSGVTTFRRNLSM
jgi:hypothetical protein